MVFSLGEFTSLRRRVLTDIQGRAKSERDIRVSAERNLAPIRAKLRGANTGDATINSVPGQVDKLIKEATSSDNLVRDCEFR